MNKFIIPAALLAVAGAAQADTLRSATLSQAVNSVQVFPVAKSAYPATPGEVVAAPSSVQTGRQSRAEFTFPDKTITRIGQNSEFSFRSGGRDIELKQGTVLLQVPKDAGGATIRTATVTAAITGTTLMFEYSPGNWIKLITLEGTQHLTIPGQDKPIAVPAGKMLILDPSGKFPPQLVSVDIAKILKTSPLAGDKVFGPLPSAALAAIRSTIELQKEAKRNGDVLPTTPIITGPGRRQADAVDDARVAAPTENGFNPIVVGPP
jgi:hypothetical protein